MHQLLQLIVQPTSEMACSLNSIWVRTQFVPALNALLRSCPECAHGIRECLRALGTVPTPIHVDNRAALSGRDDTHEERLGLR